MATRAPGPGSRTVRTCTECKQSKLRCDFKEQFPNPCSRCQARALYCTVNASFKRTPARRRLEAMNKELQELRTLRNADSPTVHQPAVTEDSNESLSQPALEELEDDFTLSVVSCYLKDELVDSSVVIEAFRIFADEFRPQLPIIGSLSIAQIYNRYIFLFWTIVVVVVYRLPEPENVELAYRLRAPYISLVQEQILDAPLPLHKIQALLFLCEWPLNVDTQPRDPTWLYCGTAIHAARYLSLDRHQTIPSLRTLGVSSGSLQTRINTWLGTFFVATSTSMHLGLPAPIDSELDFNSIQDLLLRQTLPPVFSARVRVQLVVAKFTALLNRDLDEPARASLLRLLDTEIDAIKPRRAGDDDNEASLELSILDTKMHFYALFVTKIPSGSPYREIMLKTAFGIAIRFIHIATSVLRENPGGRNDYALLRKLRSRSKNHYRGFAFATLFLLKFFHETGTASPEEKQTAENHISIALDHFKACSVERLDEYHRTARIFETLARAAPNTIGSNTLRLTHRMGVSIAFDAVADAGEARGFPANVADNYSLDRDFHPAADVGRSASDETFMSSEFNQLNPSAEYFKDFWNDPILSMLNFESTSPFPEEP